jgi:hypothetical protein
MSIGLLGAFGPMLLAPLVIFQIESSCARFCIWLPLSFALVESLLSLTSGLLDVNALLWNMAILISLSLAFLMAFCLDTPLMADLIEFITLRFSFVESCDATFNETAPCPRGVVECVGDKEMEESIFVDEGLQGIIGDKD